MNGPNTHTSSNLKEKLDAHGFDFNPQAWERMETLLDKRPPNKSYFFTKTFLAMITGLFLLWLLFWKQDAPNLSHAPVPGDGTTELPVGDPTGTLFHPLQSPPKTGRPKTALSNTGENASASQHRKAFVPNATVDSSFFLKIAARLSLLGQQRTPEKVYLHFDRTFFEPGEAIWFSAYVRDGNSLKASAKSEILYVELIAPNGSVLKKITLLAKGGTAAGDFLLGETAPGGIYKVKAYTNWQRNFEDAFERDLQVQATVLPRLRMELDFLKKAYGPGDAVEAKLDLNTLANRPLADHEFTATGSLEGQQFTQVAGKTDGKGHARIRFELPKDLATNDGLLNVLIQYNGQTESISRSVPIVLNKIDLQFLPEGGDLVADLPATVAFKALNEWGKPADVEGNILDSNGAVVASFKSYHQGMGAFDFIPQAGEEYRAVLTKPEGIQEVYDLPGAYARGFSMKVGSLKGDSLAVEVHSTEDEALHVVLVSRGEMYFTQTLRPEAGAHRVTIPVKNLPIGIAQVTLFDSREIPRAERLVFLNLDKHLKINVKTNKEKYLPREKVTLTVQVTDERGIPMPGRFSLSVADDNLLTFADDRQGHILAHLLLESELTGKVEEPNFYFDPREKHPDKDQRLALDYLMLTQGWRRFAWEEILDRLPIAAAEHVNERAVTKGLVTDKDGKPVPRLLIGVKDSNLHALTDENGRFELDTLLPSSHILWVNSAIWDGKAIRTNGSMQPILIKLPGVVENYTEYKFQPPLVLDTEPVRATKLTGTLVDNETGEPIIFGTVALYRDGVLVTGGETDFTGNYAIHELLPGTYDVEFSYTGFNPQRISGVRVSAGKANKLDGKMKVGIELQEVVVKYERPLIERDNTTQGMSIAYDSNRRSNNTPTGADKPKKALKESVPPSISSEEVANMPTRSVNALASMSAGVTIIEDANALTISGSRAEPTNYYIDGVRVPRANNEIPNNRAPVGTGSREEAFLLRSPLAIDAENRLALPPGQQEAEAFKIVEKMPQFNNGEAELKKFLSKNLKYPELAKDACITGTSVASFMVEKDGSITDAKIVRDIGGGTAEEVLRLLKMMDGKWTPAMQNGLAVRAQVTLPVKFNLDEDRKLGATSKEWSIHTPRKFYAPQYSSTAIPDGIERSDFRKTVFFAPQLEVGRNGQAVVEFYNTDAISTFRATVEGIGTDGSIGRAEQRFFTQSPFGMDVKAPVNLLSGDRIAFPLALTNNTDQALTGKLTVEAPAGFISVKQLPPTLTLRPGEALTLYPEYEVGFAKATGLADLLYVSFEADGLRDAFSQMLTVQPRGFPVHQVFGGNEREKTFTVPVSEVVEGSMVATFTVHPSVLSDLTAGLDRMLRQPNGCFEQTSSGNYPNVLVMNFLKTTGNAAPEMEKRAKDFLEQGYKRLLTFEVPGGGFDWYGKPPAHEALTAYGLMQFVDMQAVYPVEQDLIDRTAQWLLTRRDGNGGWLNGRPGLHSWQMQSPVSDAYITWAVTSAGHGGSIQKEIQKTVQDATATQDAYILALAANILLQTHSPQAGELLKLLAAQQAYDGSWTGKTHSMTHSTGKNLTVETTALAALAFLKEGKNTATIEKAVRYLAGAKTHYGFGSTQATVLALKALVSHASQVKKSIGGEVALFVNGTKAGSIPFTASQKDPIVFEHLAALLREGNNEVQVRIKGDPLPYDLAVHYHTRQPMSSPDCKLALQTVLQDNAHGGTSSSPPTVGATVRLTTTITNRGSEAVTNPIATIGIPAGLSIQPWQVKEMQEKKLFDFYEIKDGYAVFYFREMAGKEAKTIHLDLKAEIPGEYEAPASAAWLYYANDAVTWSKPERVVVGR